jgi:hypothetical protein
MAVTVNGVLGEVRWSYQLAGTLRGWTVTQDAGVWSLTGTLAQTNAFRLSQQPLAFVAPLVKGVWKWPIQTLQIADGTLTACLGPPEH